MSNEIKEIKSQLKKVIALTLEKKHQTGNLFLDTLLRKLKKEYKKFSLNEKEVSNYSELNGAVRAYFDTSLPKSYYEDPFGLELGKLESMLREHYAKMNPVNKIDVLKEHIQAVIDLASDQKYQTYTAFSDLFLNKLKKFLKKLKKMLKELDSNGTFTKIRIDADVRAYLDQSLPRGDAEPLFSELGKLLPILDDCQAKMSRSGN